MLDQDTKKKIDSARDILVGKVPDPKAQAEQITNALIYKFMDDMDKESLLLGGKASFFIGKYSKYSWSKLSDNSLSGQERLQLYKEALENMPKNEALPAVFRNILKDAFLPYNDPYTLNLFLKEINEFSYKNSESLGDAFEYLLSILSAQGDAGQFRTPRHIIDFIVSVVMPKKDETILDPACGTAGFLISAYKYILKENEKKPLTPAEKIQLVKNFTGYDISPDMVKLSLANMFLHGFKEPSIYDYDTLTFEDRWNESFDVILANPPFMTPKGGIRPHGKFRIKANRSEVLFIDYIVEHLNIKGRAGIIVPEGIIFITYNAYKNLRKMLIDDNYLYAVANLPAGIFQPYSKNKTSILFIDKQTAKQRQEILFVNVENDGFDLGAQRRPINENDLPQALEIIREFQRTGKIPAKIKNARLVAKTEIAKDGIYGLASERYAIEKNNKKAKFEEVRLGDIVSTITPPKKLSTDKFMTSGKYPIIDQSQDYIAGYSDDAAAVVAAKKPVIIFGDHTCAVKYIDFDFIQGADGIKILRPSDNVNSKYLFYFLLSNGIKPSGYKRHFGELKNIKIPLPSLADQSSIVSQIEKEQNIIAANKELITIMQSKIEKVLNRIYV